MLIVGVVMLKWCVRRQILITYGEFELYVILPNMNYDNKRNQGEDYPLYSGKAWVEFFAHKPCVKTSFLWGIGCGALLFAHKTRLYKGVSIDNGIVGVGIIFSV